MTPAGVERLKLDEGCRLSAYPDPESGAEPWTIGYGCTGPGIGPHTRWSQTQADAALLQRVASTESALRHGLAWFSHLETTQPVRADVLVNIAFNVGTAGLERWRVTLGAVERGDYAAASEDILSNHVWQSEVGERCNRCADAMKTGSWA